MSEHLTEAAIGQIVQTWCSVCKKLTRHRIDRVAVDSHAGKPGPCLEHGPKVNTRGESKKQEATRIKRERQTSTRDLFR